MNMINKAIRPVLIEGAAVKLMLKMRPKVIATLNIADTNDINILIFIMIN